jgi:Subtilase family
MRRVAAAALLAIATVIGSLQPGCAQPAPAPSRLGAAPTNSGLFTPLSGVVFGSVVCAAVAPMIDSAILGRELTMREGWGAILSCVLGPLGCIVADHLIPPEPPPPITQVSLTPTQPPPRPPRGRHHAHGRNISIPRRGVAFAPNEILVEIEPGTSPQDLITMANRLELTRLESQSFALTGRTIELWHIDGSRSVPATLRLLSGYGFVSAAQANIYYRGQQAPAAAPQGETAQYMVSKLHLLEAHRITNGDNVLVAVIDSQIDTHHPDLAGVFAGEYNALATPGPPHMHGTAMAGAIAAHSKLIGVAPKVKLLAVRAFAGSGESAQGTTFAIMKGLDWAASKGARIVNMSFAGPGDPMFREMLGKAYERGIVLIAAVGNAGPRSPPLFPAADPDVIGVTATDENDKLMPQANRGKQVALAAPGVEVLVPAPDASYQLTTGTSVAAAITSGVAALLLARNPKLTPDAVKKILEASAHAIRGKRTDVGAGEIDALAAVRAAATPAITGR